MVAALPDPRRTGEGPDRPAAAPCEAPPTVPAAGASLRSQVEVGKPGSGPDDAEPRLKRLLALELTDQLHAGYSGDSP